MQHNTLPTMQVTEDQFRLLVPLHALDGEALEWYEQHHQGEKAICTWEQFKEEIQARFHPYHEQEKLRDNLMQLRQMGKVEEHGRRFLDIATRITEMSTADKMYHFNRSLKPEVTGETARMARTTPPKDLLELIQIAMDGEDSMFKSKQMSQSIPGSTYHSNLGKRVMAISQLKP